MACEANFFWYYEFNDHYIAKTNTSAAGLGSFDPNDSAIRGLACDGIHIWAINTSGTIKSYNKAGLLEETIDGLLTGGWGLCTNGTYLWASDPGTDKIYQIALEDDITAPEPPVIMSPTHTASTTWYSNPDPIFLWTPPEDPSGIEGYSYLIDGSADTEPDEIIDGTDTMMAYELLGDGPWYFHCRARDGVGNWSEASHLRILIDTTPPGEGTISINDGADTTFSILVTLNNLTATDFASGMGEGSGMKFSNDMLSWSDEEPFVSESAVWDLMLYGGNTISGTKPVYVSYKDIAGNWSEAFGDDIVYSAPLMITTDTLSSSIVGYAYAETLAAAGGWPPYQWDIITGDLPPGLSLTTDGIISGEPESEGDFTFRVRITDSNMNAQSLQFDISISMGAVKGDLNADALIDILDLILVIRYILHQEDFTPTEFWAADVQADSVINVLDALAIVNIILGTPMAKTMPSAGGATLWIDGSTVLSGEGSRHSICLDSPGVTVGGAQFSITLPRGSTLTSPPASPSFTLSYKEDIGDLKVVLYSLTGAPVFATGSQTLLAIDLPGGAAPIGIESVTLADANGESIPVSIKTDNAISPSGFVLHQNYPNPFNPTTDIRYQIPDSRYTTQVTLKVYNLIGQEVRTLVDETGSPGQHTITWDGRDTAGAIVPSGVYFCKMKTGETTQAIKMILSK